MSLAPGVQLGPYQIITAIGAGGMGEVYRAHDTRLNRDVAIKILPETFAGDADRLARFHREAQLLASLNHPNIAHIYGFENGALVLELVDGPTLAERIALGAIPVDEALAIARQVTDGLEAAHDQGIVHRDLKPANIKLKPDGTIKVLDFGLAKAFASEPLPSTVSMSPTVTSPAQPTQAGMIIGTAAYMSPEQARGKPVDKRTDIWAFGCVLYEMLTAQRAFGGDEITDVLAFIITKEPDRAALPRTTPPALQRLLNRCLEKDRKRRLADISDARLEIDEALTQSQRPVSADAVSVAALRRGHTWVAIAGAVAVGAAAAAVIGWILMPVAAPTTPQRFAINMTASAPFDIDRLSLAISPDGKHVVYPVNQGGKRSLYLRSVDQLEGQPIRGTDDGSAPFFSPDGESIAFFAATGSASATLKRVPARGGAAIPIAPAFQPNGGVWAADDTIIFGSNASGRPAGLWKVPASSGEPTALTSLKAEERRHGWPDLLPDGSAIIYSVRRDTGSYHDGYIVARSLETGEERTIIPSGYHARYVTSGHIVYLSRATLMAVPFDVGTLQTRGPAVPVIEDLRIGQPAFGHAALAVSPTGYLVYASGNSDAAPRNVVWVDRHGREEALGTPERSYVYPRISPDGALVALDVRGTDNDIWLWTLARKTFSKVTSGAGTDRFPVWMSDSRRIVFERRGADFGNFYVQSADGTGVPQEISQSTNVQFPQALTPDGSSLLLINRTRISDTSDDIALLSLGGEKRLRTLVSTTATELNAELSPNGQWLAYESNETGREEIYVRPFPNVDDAKFPISAGGGTRPLWSRSGTELFYLSGHSPSPVTVMTVAVQAVKTFSAGAPAKVFEGPFLASQNIVGRSYDVSPDGQRFLMIKELPRAIDDVVPSSLTVVLNWFDELKRIAPARNK